MTERLRLGAPGVYELPDVPLRVLTGERMDVCAFVGVAPRGPARKPFFHEPWAPAPCAEGQPVQRSVPVVVESWSAYQRLFGGFEGPGLLPYSVASFFENGGRRAYVVRIVHDYGSGNPSNDAGVARARLMGVTLPGGVPLWLRARNEGTWGNKLSARMSFSARPLAFDPGTATATSLALARDTELPAGSLLRLTLAGGTQVLSFVADARNEWDPESGVTVLRATLASSVGGVPELAEIVEGLLTVDDGDGRTERLERLGLASSHPRWLARALVEQSELLYPDERPDKVWVDQELVLTPALAPCGTEPFTGGEDRYPEIIPEDFIDTGWTPGDECPGDGVQSLADTAEIALLVVPDLYSPEPLVAVEDVVSPVSLAGAEFAPCVPLAPAPEQAAPVPELKGLQLNPELPAELDTIIALQQELVTFAEQCQSFIVLLDVPPRLNTRRVLAWRTKFASAFAAAYSPWLMVTRRDDQRDAIIRVNPSAVAAGIIARRELESGVQYGPANVLAEGVVDVTDRLASAQHDTLHQASINVFLRERDGIRLTAARTLSLDPNYRQLSVRRLMTLLCRVLERQMQWVVFEPNNGRLRGEVRQLLRTYLRQLFLANAFQGAREEEAFFVRCDETLNSRQVVDSGRLIAEVGVAPAEPLEFLVLQIAREGDGTLRVGG
ncbi:phage tail sheath subtilisin-like domain-containing protein [Hyalangium versicolor]|uniref:phage tail sheath subtilisin-like domain-containing protein n=1 Tax=Hyalangium versicolor TaxID=2861190 RepID=UPI001CCFE0BD|nr:phage tail sheath subtilisin-like domain-containing protein [Hyalangium versicolor]